MFKPETGRWCKIDYTINGNPFFRYKGKRYHLDNFIRCHNNPWIGEHTFPDYIHGYQADNYYDPLFIEVNTTGEAVKVYREILKAKGETYANYERTERESNGIFTCYY